MAILNTNNTAPDDQAKADDKPEAAKSATEQPAAATPGAKKLRQPRAKSKPAGSDGERTAKTAKPTRDKERKAKRNDAAPTNRPKAADAAKSTKAEQVLKKLRVSKGA